MLRAPQTSASLCSCLGCMCRILHGILDHFGKKAAFDVANADFFGWTGRSIFPVLVVGRLSVDIRLVLFVKVCPSFPFGVVTFAEQHFQSVRFPSAVAEAGITNLAVEYEIAKGDHGCCKLCCSVFLRTKRVVLFGVVVL